MAGFGQSPFGQTPFGGESVFASVSLITVVDARTSIIVFSDPVTIDAALTNPANYVWTTSTGAAITSLTVSVTTTLGLGAISVTVTHSGTTFGSVYTCTVNNVTDLGSQPLLSNSKTRLGSSTTFGSLLTAVATPADNQVSVTLTGDTFLSAMNAETVGNYDLTTAYPISPEIDAVTLISSDTVLFDLSYITTTNYDLTLGVANALDYTATVLPDVAPGITATDFGTGTSTIAASKLNMSTDTQYGWSFSFSPEDSTKIQIPVDLTVTGSTSVTTLVSLNDAVVKEVLFAFLPAQVNITIRSGGFSQTTVFSYDPYASAFDLYIEENDLSGIFAVGFIRSGVLTPAASTLSSSLVSASSNPNTLRLSLESAAYDVRFGGVSVSSSATLYTSSFNFVHNIPLTFLGVSTTVVNFIETEHGPLVKDWGDYTPAGIDDVSVSFNGSPYSVIGVNPYMGQIFVNPPIPKVPSGTISVEVDYKYMPDATFGMVLNVPGLGFNTFSRPFGRISTGISSIAFPDTLPHRYRVLLGPDTSTIQPACVGHRFLAVEKGYSAVLNDPSSLVLNSGSGGTFKAPTKTFVDSYNLRAESIVDWNSLGSVVDSPDGMLATGSGSYIYEDIEIQPESQVAISALILPQTPVQYDGVWSGIGAGFQDSSSMFLAGLLTINGVDHAGIATGNNLSLASSWTVVGTKTASLDSTTSLRIPSQNIPSHFSVGHRFQVLSGNQAGVYTVVSREDVGNESFIEFSPAVPNDPTLWGNNSADITPELLWQDQRVFLLTQVLRESVSIVVSSQYTVSDSLTVRRSPFPLFSEWETGRVFVGNMGLADVSQTILVAAFQSDPTSNPFITRRSAIDADLSDLESQGWFFKKSDAINAGSEAQIVRYDSAFSNGSITVSDLEFQATSQGWDSFKCFEIRDRKRRIEVYAIVYEESGTRQLVSTPNATLSPVSPWSGTFLPTVRPDVISFVKGSADTGNYISTLSGGNRNNTARSLQFSLRGAGAGFEIFLDSGASLKDVSVIFSAGTISLGSNGTPISSTSLDWDDQEFHTFEVSIGSSVTLEVDGVSVITSLISAFSATATTTNTGIRLFGASTCGIDVKYINAFEVLPTTATYKRSFGFKVNDTGNFDNDWILPISSASSAANSSLAKPVVEVPWESSSEILRIHFDPSYGVVMELPSVAALPGTFTTDYATQNTNPSRGYCSIEYRSLPFDPIPVGSVMFATGKGNILDIASMEYQILQTPLQNPQNTRFMVLNRTNIIQSGEYNIDTTPEIVAISRINPSTISLRDAHYNASLVYQVLDGGSVRTDFSFDKSTQTITMNSDLSEEIVTVYFVPTRPVTSTYVRSQPESFTTLLDRTPPFVWSQTEQLARIVLYGVEYDGSVTEIASDDGSSVLPVKGPAESSALYVNTQSYEFRDSGMSTVAIAQDTLLDFTLTVLP